MRFHLLGVGSIGSLIGFHLKRSIRAQRAQLLPPSPIQARDRLLQDSISNDPHTDRRPPSTAHIPPHVVPHLPDSRETSVTLHVRERLFARQLAKRHNNSIVIERGGVRAVEAGFNVERTNAASDILASVVRTDEEASGFFHISRSAGRTTTTSPTPIPDSDNGVSTISLLEGKHADPHLAPIDSLIITTKCDATVAALRPLLPRLHPWSTVVLIQNGMGVMDMLIDRLFQDPEKRPNFVLGTTTHGVWRKAPLNVVHAGVGELHFSVVPNERAGSLGFEKALDAEVAARSIASASAAAAAYALPPLRKPASSGWDKFAPSTEDAASAPYSHHDSPPPTVPALLDVDGIPDVPSLRTLRYTVSSLLALPLNVHWIPIREYQLKALRKLAINACINPLTALADCKNGDLFANPPALDAMWQVCLEVSQVLEAQVRDYLHRQSQEEDEDDDDNQEAAAASRRRTKRKPHSSISNLATAELLLHTGQDGKPALDPSLTAATLYKEAERTVRLTAANWSSMHADLAARRGSTEVEYINGYISALGRGYGVETPANDMLVNLIKLKTGKLTGSSST
ncbi:2-dehydropantoate 2-reductase (Ketopantoate reductase) (KPA reductase) (KPR) [Thecaphora frezii]